MGDARPAAGARDPSGEGRPIADRNLAGNGQQAHGAGAEISVSDGYGSLYLQSEGVPGV